jgi:hypothetical protein
MESAGEWAERDRRGEYKRDEKKHATGAREAIMRRETVYRIASHDE